MNEDAFLREVRFVARRIVQSQKAKRELAVWLYWIHVGLVVLFSLLGTAGLLATKPEDLSLGRGPGFVLALVSFIVIVVLELYRAYQIEKIALKKLAAHEAFTLVERRAENALTDTKPWEQFEAILADVRTLAVTFADVLRGEHEADVKALVDSWARQFRPKDGWTLPPMQQKKKRKPAGGDA